MAGNKSEINDQRCSVVFLLHLIFHLVSQIHSFSSCQESAQNLEKHSEPKEVECAHDTKEHSAESYEWLELLLVSWLVLALS